MVTAVEALPGRGIGQPEVGAAVDDQLAVQAGGERSRGTVRQREEHHVVARQGGGVRGPDLPVRDRCERRMVVADATARAGAGGHRGDLDVRVAEQQAQQFTAGVPRRTGDGDRERHDTSATGLTETAYYARNIIVCNAAVVLSR